MTDQNTDWPSAVDVSLVVRKNSYGKSQKLKFLDQIGELLSKRSFTRLLKKSKNSPQSMLDVGGGYNASLLKPALEILPQKGKWNWKDNNCSATGVCDESGVWFPWEIRDAAISLGGIKTANEFQSFFGKLSNEIAAGCTAGLLSYGIPGFNPSAKSAENIPKRQLIDTTVSFLTSLQKMEQTGTLLRPSIGSNPEELSVWKRVLRSERVITNGDYEIWRAFGSPISALNDFYKSLFAFFPILIFTFYFLNRSSKRYEFQKYLALNLIISVVIYCIIVSVTQISAGFQIEKQLYLIPVQPIFVLLFALMTTIVIARLMETKDE